MRAPQLLIEIARLFYLHGSGGGELNAIAFFELSYRDVNRAHQAVGMKFSPNGRMRDEPFNQRASQAGLS